MHIRIFPVPTGIDPAEFCTKARFVHMREFHYDPQHNFLWVDSIVGGTIPNNFLPAVEKGFKERLERGVIAGYQVQNVGVEVYFGKHHPVDSSEAAFKTAGSMAFRNVFQQAKPGLLEPIVTLHVTVPGSKLGDINSDMSGRRGRVLGMDSAGGDLQTVTAEVPLAEVTTYARVAVQHHRRARQLHDGVQPLRRGAGQRAKRDRRQDGPEGGGRRIAPERAFCLNLAGGTRRRLSRHSLILRDTTPRMACRIGISASRVPLASCQCGARVDIPLARRQCHPAKAIHPGL